MTYFYLQGYLQFRWVFVEVFSWMEKIIRRRRCSHRKVGKNPSNFVH